MFQARSLAMFLVILLVLRYVLRIRVSIVGSLLLTLVVGFLLAEWSRRSRE